MNQWNEWDAKLMVCCLVALGLGGLELLDEVQPEGEVRGGGRRRRRRGHRRRRGTWNQQVEQGLTGKMHSALPSGTTPNFFTKPRHWTRLSSKLS